MKVYSKTGSEPAWICGHWNASPLQVGMGLRKEIGANEVMHSHPYCEYYIAIEGEAEMQVGHDQVKLAPGAVVMVEPGEEHMVSSVAKDGAFWIVVKERSEPGTKMISSTDCDDESKS
jgi:mannose-6-phosphate isomerase-like protein (cupin superfamily)